MSELKCPKCGSDKLFLDALRGELVCTECGTVVSQMIDQGAEWRPFESDERARTGLGYSTYGKVAQKIHLPTYIDETDKDLLGRPLTPTQRKLKRKLIRAQIFATMTPEYKPLFTARDLLRKKRLLLNLPESIIDEALVLFDQAFKKGLLRSCPTEAIVDAILFYLCKDLGITRKEIARASSRKLKEIDRAYRILVFNKVIRSRPTSLTTLVERYGRLIGFPSIAIHFSKKLADMVIKERLHLGKDPRPIVGAILYMIPLLAEGEKIPKLTFSELAELLGTTEVTIRNRYEEICDKLGQKIGYIDSIKRA